MTHPRGGEFFLLFLAHSIYSSYLCGREEVINNISDDYSTAKKL